MLNLLIFFAIALIVFRYARGILRNQKSSPRVRPQRPPAQPSALSADTLVACSVCGTYFNPTQGQKIGEKYYCNAKCASLKS
jgi:hypothetical protein